MDHVSDPSNPLPAIRDTLARHLLSTFIAVLVAVVIIFQVGGILQWIMLGAMLPCLIAWRVALAHVDAARAEADVYGDGDR